MAIQESEAATEPHVDIGRQATFRHGLRDVHAEVTEIEAAANQWSVRELERQISTSLYQRLALSRDKEEIRRLATELDAMLADAEFRQKLANVGMTPWRKTPEEMTALIRSELARYEEVVRLGHIRAE